MEGDIVSSTTMLRKGPILLGLEIACMFDLGKGATGQWERGEEPLDDKERDLEKKKKTFILIVCENGVLVFKQCYLSKNHVQVMCY